MKTAPCNINTIWRETKVDRRTIQKILDGAGIQPIKPGGNIYPDEALQAVAAWKAEQYDEDTEGESPFKRLARLKGDEIARQNRIAEALDAKTLVEVDKVEKLVLIFVGKLELIPVKMESEFGLDKKIITRLTELLDEARREMSKAASQA